MPRELSADAEKRETSEEKTSGMEEPAAMSVAPVGRVRVRPRGEPFRGEGAPLTSSDSLNLAPKTSKLATKYSSQTTAKPRRQYRMPAR